MKMEDFKSFKTKKCCFTCAHYTSGKVNIIGFYCVNGVADYQRADYVCGKHRPTAKNDKQLEEDYKVLEKKCR